MWSVKNFWKKVLNRQHSLIDGKVLNRQHIWIDGKVLNSHPHRLRLPRPHPQASTPPRPASQKKRKKQSSSQTIEEVSAIISSTCSSKSELFSRGKGLFKVWSFRTKHRTKQDAAIGTEQNTERRTPRTPNAEQRSPNKINIRTKRRTPNSVQWTPNTVHGQSWWKVKVR